MIGSVLVANRGEIALRIVRTCAELGIRSIVAHSVADRDSPAVRLADEAVCIGPAPASRSYLDAAALIQAAIQCGAEAVHPGYGFLAEDADFALACREHGLVFVGPPPEVMATLGDKAAAREAAAGAGLPVLPGGVVRGGQREARALADAVGYPVLLKPVAGGGGRGMGLVRDPEEFAEIYRETRATARALFGDDGICVERFLPRARHVEVQVLADGRGGVIHLGERDCSVQRRRQKLVEESPAPGLPPQLVADMASAAVTAAKELGYVGAGTFEFLVDQDSGEFFFIEVNCRLQVEHPVTEMVAGVDLVREQLLLAGGAPLSLRQEEVALRGAAVECRINAEDPDRGFAPAPGVLRVFEPPGGPFVRVDAYGAPGVRVPPEYDPLIGKIICWGPDRDQALDRMDRALRELRVAGDGIVTGTGHLRHVINHPLFRKAEHTTALLDEISQEFP